ncbi:MAG: DUF58 domain-containing protein [Acidobacteriota bacterium]
MRVGRGLMALTAALVPTALLAVAWEPAAAIWRWQALASVVTVLAAMVELLRLPELRIERLLPGGGLALGQWTDVILRLRQEAGRRRRLHVFDHHPEPAEVQGLPHVAMLPAEGWLETTHRFRPLQRGLARFTGVEVLVTSFFDLLRRRVWIELPLEVRVLPNYRPALRSGLAAAESTVALAGVHQQRRRGEGLEFEQLRDYRHGDSLRQVDWKASARRPHLVSRQYREERDQQVVLMIDCGRRMASREGELGHLDAVLESAVVLAHVALQAGDAVGAMSFAGPHRFLSPLKGRAALPALLDTLGDLQPTDQEPDYRSAFLKLMTLHRRRSLLVVMSNLRDESVHELGPALATVSRRHLVMVGSLRESSLRVMSEEPVEDFESARDVAAAHHYLEQRRRAHERLGSWCTACVDVETKDLAPALVQRYVEIKRAGLL